MVIFAEMSAVVSQHRIIVRIAVKKKEEKPSFMSTAYVVISLNLVAVRIRDALKKLQKNVK